MVSQSWTDYMKAVHVSEKDQKEANRLDQDEVRFHPERIGESLKEVDHFTALAVRDLGWEGGRRDSPFC